MVRTALLLLLLVGALWLHFDRGVIAGRLSPEAMDAVQAARCTAVNGLQPCTKSIPPLLTAYVSPNPDGSLPDLGHAPLYPVIAAVGMRLAHHTGMGLGDKVTALLSLLCLAAALGACLLLSRSLFGARGGGEIACVLWALSGTAMTLALQPHPALLGALLFTLLLLALGELSSPARVALAGALYGLLYLTLYSALLLLPALIVYLWRATEGKRRGLALVIFFTAALLVASPQLTRDARLTHNPFFNAHLLDLMARTPRYPGDRLYRSALPPETVWEFLASGGAEMVLRKSASTIGELYGRIPGVIGPLLLPLFLGAALIRFSDARVNRLRDLIYIGVLCHLIGVAPFLSAEEAAPSFLIYAPPAAAFGMAFLLSTVRARNLPRFAERTLIGGWAALACLPGVLLMFSPVRDTSPVYEVYYYLNTDSPEMRALRARGGALLIASDAPWETAFRCDAPSVWLPMDGAEMLQTEQQTGRRIAGVVLTPGILRGDAGDTALPQTWTVAYNRIVGLWGVASDLPPAQRGALLGSVALHYPSELSDTLKGFRPAPLAESEGEAVSLLLWDGGAVPLSPAASPVTGPHKER